MNGDSKHGAIIIWKPKKTIQKIIKELFELYYKNAFKLFLASGRWSLFMHKFLPKEFIIFLGTSSSGKSTLAKEYVKNNSETVLIECDKIGEEMVCDFLKEKKGALFNRLYNRFGDSLLYYIHGNVYTAEDPFNIQRHFDNVDLLRDFIELRDFFVINRHAINSKLLLKIAEDVRRYQYYGLTVILDIVAAREHLLIFSEMNPIRVLVYCPFSSIANHVLKRNGKALINNEPMEYRHLLKVYKLFSIFFKAERTQNDIPSLETLNRRQVLSLLDSAFKADRFYRDEDCYDPEAFKKKFLREIGFCGKDEVVVFPPHWDPHFIFSTEQSSPEELALFLKNYLIYLRSYFNNHNEKHDENIRMIKDIFSYHDWQGNLRLALKKDNVHFTRNNSVVGNILMHDLLNLSKLVQGYHSIKYKFNQSTQYVDRKVILLTTIEKKTVSMQLQFVKFKNLTLLLKELETQCKMKKAYFIRIKQYCKTSNNHLSTLVKQKFIGNKTKYGYTTPLHLCYFFEKVDPYHRPFGNGLAEHIEFYINEGNKIPEQPPFFIWLESLPHEHPVWQSKQVQYFEEVDNQVIVGSIENKLPLHKLYIRIAGEERHEPFDTRNMLAKSYEGGAYVLAKDGNLYAGDYVTNYKHHTSYCAGDEVLCSGMMAVRDGIVFMINNASGHYRLTLRKFLNGINHLQNLGILDHKNVDESLHTVKVVFFGIPPVESKTFNSSREFIQYAESIIFQENQMMSSYKKLIAGTFILNAYRNFKQRALEQTQPSDSNKKRQAKAYQQE